MASTEVFEQAIRDEPADDGLRLIYADWLEENDQPDRAEFIRLQIELARLPEEHSDRRLLEMRERALLKRSRATWLEGLPEWARDTAVFRRGFVAQVEASVREWQDDGAVVRGHSPIDQLVLQ